MTDMRDLVRTGYNEGSYDTVYARKGSSPERFERSLCDELLERLPKRAKLLDLGCGVGLPYDRYFVKNGCSVTGVDISERHVELAKRNVPEAQFKVGDFFASTGSAKFDAIVSLYAIFHIPRTEHAKLLAHLHAKLKRHGLILITLGTEPMVKDVSDDFVGAPMAWSSYSVANNKRLVRNAGFDIIMAVEDYRHENHLWILARKA